jgi:hypothetical protein
MHYPWPQIVLDEQLTSASGLGLALGAQPNIDPSSEQILGVPITFAVP